MRNCLIGIVLALLLFGLGAFGFALLGLMPTVADATPPAWEARFAMFAADASAARHAPRLNNPMLPTDDVILDGMKLYTMNCAGCHGGPDMKISSFGASFYPPAPQLILNPLDDPEWKIFYTIRTGTRYTGMPAWGKSGLLTEQQMWEITAFLSHLEKLSPAVKEIWRKSFGVDAPSSPALEK
jgi:mono/diheme cytochrome c family protein